MIGIYILIGCIFAGFLFFVVSKSLQKSRRKQWQAVRLDVTSRARLTEVFPLYGRLPTELRDRLDGLIEVFVQEKSFEPCGDLEEVSLSQKHAIAAQACLLIVNRPHDYYAKLRSVLVYPTAYTARNEHGGQDTRLGESWGSGSVVLAWDSVASGGRNEEDGHHVTIHEFAHQLDQADGNADGVPDLDSTTAYREWAMVFSKAFGRFLKKLEKGKRTVIDPYGGTNPAEFFAVSTETFFEKPEQLAKKYPDVYRLLKDYYRLDPINWLSN